MIIRKLKREEIPQAMELAKAVFDVCVRNVYCDEAANNFFDSYARIDNLMAQYDSHKLELFGAFQNKKLLAMSSMTTDGQITMVYVIPRYSKRHIGRKLVREMRIHARMQLNLTQVTVNAIPAMISGFFRRLGFVDIYANPVNEPYVPLYKKSIYQVDYEKKEIPRGLLLGGSIAMAVGFFLLGMFYILSLI